MYYKWLDHWDERRALRGDKQKEKADFAFGAEIAFPGAKKVGSISEFCNLADVAASDPNFFDEPNESELEFGREADWIVFRSCIRSEVEENNIVRSRVTKGRFGNQALIVFHHWNASSRYKQLANFFSRRGVTVVEIAMPYHFERSRPASLHADYMLSPNLGRTIHSMRQAVLDGRKLIRVLKSEGYSDISVLGISLGSWVAGLVAAHDQTVRKAALFLTAGSLADMVWSGRATQHIRDSFRNKIELSELRRAWGPLNLENYADRLARPDLKLQFVLAKRDTVVRPKLSKSFMLKLESAGARLGLLELNCGHYSLSLPPYILRAGFSVSRLLACSDPLTFKGSLQSPH